MQRNQKIIIIYCVVEATVDQVKGKFVVVEDVVVVVVVVVIVVVVVGIDKGADANVKYDVCPRISADCEF